MVHSYRKNQRMRYRPGLHGCATTTEAIRRAIQHSQESLRTLAKRDGVNPKTVAKWRKRGSVADLPTGPKVPKSTVLSIEDEAIIVGFRRHTFLPLDDCLYGLQPTIDRTSKFAFVELHEKAMTKIAADFLRHLIAAVPYKIHTVLTDNGIQFTTPDAGGSAVFEIKEAMARSELFRAQTRLREERYRPSGDQAPLDEWAGRENEPNHQR